MKRRVLVAIAAGVGVWLLWFLVAWGVFDAAAVHALTGSASAGLFIAVGAYYVVAPDRTHDLMP